jgi:hypothetical protein
MIHEHGGNVWLIRTKKLSASEALNLHNPTEA